MITEYINEIKKSEENGASGVKIEEQKTIEKIESAIKRSNEYITNKQYEMNLEYERMINDEKKKNAAVLDEKKLKAQEERLLMTKAIEPNIEKVVSFLEKKIREFYGNS